MIIELRDCTKKIPKGEKQYFMPSKEEKDTFLRICSDYMFGKRWESGMDFPGGASCKEPTRQCRRSEMQVRSLNQKDPLEKGMATHSSMLAWSIPWTEETGRPQSVGSHRVGHDWSNLACAHAKEWYESLSVLEYLREINKSYLNKQVIIPFHDDVYRNSHLSQADRISSTT